MMLCCCVKKEVSAEDLRFSFYVAGWGISLPKPIFLNISSGTSTSAKAHTGLAGDVTPKLVLNGSLWTFLPYLSDNSQWGMLQSLTWPLTWQEQLAEQELCAGIVQCWLCSLCSCSWLRQWQCQGRGERVCSSQCLYWTLSWELFAFQLCWGCVKSLEDADCFCWHSTTP